MNEFEQCISEWADRCREARQEAADWKAKAEKAEQAIAQVRREAMQEALSYFMNHADESFRLWLHEQATLAGVKACQHEWGTDGQHSNEFCKRCFANKEEGR